MGQPLGMHPEPICMIPKSTLMFAVPGETPVTIPVVLATVMTEVLLLLHVPLTVN